MAQAIWKRWWWVGGFSLLAAGLYLSAMNEKKTAIEELSFRYQEVQKEKLLALCEKEDLALQIASQSDPAWIEMVLMRDLGLVPDGWLKVHFKNCP